MDLKKVVGATGFKPATPCSRGNHAPARAGAFAEAAIVHCQRDVASLREVGGHIGQHAVLARTKAVAADNGASAFAR